MVPTSRNLTFANPPEEAELGQIERVLHVERTGPGAYRIRFSGDDSIAERIVALSVEKGWRLHEISMERCSLDVIFAQLSGKLKNNI